MFKFKFFATFFFCCTPFLAHSAVFFVAEPSGEVFSADMQAAQSSLKELVKSEVLSRRHSVVNSPEQSRWILEPALLRIGRSYVVTLSKLRNGRLVYSQKLKAQTLDDLDVVVARLVRAVVRNQNVENTQQVDTVTQQEQIVGPGLKTKVIRQFYFGFGPGALSNLESEDTGLGVTVGYLWGIDKKFSLRLGLERADGDGDANVWTLGLGGQHYLNLNKHAPYLLGLAGYSWAESDVPDDDAFFGGGVDDNGFSVQVGVGVHFFRTASVNLAAEIAYTRGFFEVLDDSPGVFGGRILVFW